MQKITVKKHELLTTLVENKQTHVADFELAWDSYHQKVLDNVTALLANAKKARRGEPIELYLGLTAPVNHVEDYDRAIKMIDWETSDEVELSESDFQQLVEDDWDWKRQFTVANTLYTGKASPSKA